MALATARRLAAEHPEAMLPCPLCGSGVRGANLDRHVGDQHSRRPQTELSTSWTGADRVVLRRVWMVSPVGLALAAAFVLGDAPLRRMAAFLALGVAIAVVCLLLATLTGLPRAHLRLDGDAAELRHTMGLGSRRVRLPAELEIGALWAKQQLGPAYMRSTVDTKTGTYLHLGSTGRGITVGCRKSTDIRKHWSGAQAGKRRRSWDITVDQAAFVELQYALAARGELALRAD